MAEETQPEAAAAAAAAAEVVVTEAAAAEAEVPAAAETEAEAEAEKKADEAAVTADDAGEGTGSFKEESNLVEDLPDPEKKALDEFKQLIAAALAAGEFNLPPPPPPPKAKEEPKAEETKTEEAKTEEPAKEEPKAEAEAAAEEAKAEVAVDSPAEEVKTEVPPAEEAKAETVAEEAKPAESEPQEKTVVVAEEETATKAVEAIEETVVSAPAATSEETAAPEAVAETEAAAPEPVLIWGVPLVGDDERTDTVLLKFLRAREFKVKEAMAMLKSAVLWRKRFGITSLLDADLGLPELENVVFYRGADREGHPVCYNVYGEFQDKDLYEKAFGDDEKRERFLKWRIQLLERGILSKLDFSPSGICSMVQVTDLKNSPPMLGKHRTVTRQAVTLLQDNYPEFIAKKVFINVPWWYLAANKVMSPFLTQRTKSKFVFVSPAKSAETLFRYIAPEQVPVQFGGLFKEDDPEFTTSDTVTELTIEPSSKATIEIPVTENSTIAWELQVLGWEVSYGAEFTPDTEGGYADIVQKTRKVPAKEEPIMKGSFKASEPGKLVLTVNNPTSKKKKLLYRSKTRPAPPRPPLLCSPAIRTAGVWELLLRPLGSIWELFQRLRARSIYSVDKGPPNEWVLDSGAWIHYTSNLALLLEGGDFQSQKLDNKDAPSSGDDDTAPHVQGRGSVRTDCFDFPGVHYVVGDDTRNVVSVSQLARDHGLVTVFEPTSCHVKDKKIGKIVGKGRLRNGVYMLDSLRIVGQYIGDGGGSGHNRRDGADESEGGGRGRGHEGRGNGEGDSIGEERGGGRRDGRGEGTEARSQEKGSGSGAAGGDVNEGNDEKEIEEMIGNDEDDIKEIGEINDKGEKEEDEKRGGQNFGQFSSRPHTGLFGMSLLACILWIVCILCIAACILLPFTSWGAGVKILAMDFHSLAGFWVPFILGLHLLKTCMMQSTMCKPKQIGSLFRGTSGNIWELSHEELNKQLFGLSRFDVTTDPTGYGRCQLHAGAFPTSTNAQRWEEFLVDSGASFHAIWKESILFPYRPDLQNHYKPPTPSFEGIAGSVAVTKCGYLNGKIRLDGVLLAPESRMNLVSVGQLSIQYGVKVEMDDEGVIIKKKQNGVQIGGGKMLNNHLYVLEEFKPPEHIFAHLKEPHPSIFGNSTPPGLAQ